MIISSHYRRGFTLVEILTAIAIISILASVIMATVYNARTESRDLSRQTDLQQFKLGLKLYKETYGEYPDYPEGAPVGIGGGIDSALAPFVADVKSDPLSTGSDGDYNYWYFSALDCAGEARVVMTAQTVENEKHSNADNVCNGEVGVAHDLIILIN